MIYALVTPGVIDVSRMVKAIYEGDLRGTEKPRDRVATAWAAQGHLEIWIVLNPLVGTPAHKPSIRDVIRRPPNPAAW